MKLELKNLKIHKDMSEETLCFSATLYVDGKKAANVQNNGHGGCHRYHWEDETLGARVNALAKTQPLEIQSEHLDQLIDALIVQKETRKFLARQMRKKTLFRLKGDKKGEWRTINSPYTSAVEAFIVKKYGVDVEVIANNNMEAAVAIAVK
jgi:hypothetical protein